MLKEDGAEHLLLIGEELVGARARAVLQDAAFDLGGRRGRRGGELGERLATVLDAADDSEREGLLRVE